MGVLLAFYQNFWGILALGCMFLIWNFFGIFGEFLGFFWEFFWNSLEILSEFFGDVWLGGSECVGVDFG